MIRSQKGTLTRQLADAIRGESVLIAASEPTPTLQPEMASFGPGRRSPAVEILDLALRHLRSHIAAALP